MSPTIHTVEIFDETRQDNGWIRVAEFSVFAEAGRYLGSPRAAWLRGEKTRTALKEILPAAEAHASAIGDGVDKLLVAFDRSERAGYLSLVNRPASSVWVWQFDIDAVDPTLCFERMGALACGDSGCLLRFVPQEDRAFMWKAPLVHPMQVRENDYQRVVHAAGRDPGELDAIAAEYEALEKFFIQDAGIPEPLPWKPLPEKDTPYAAVRMNHLIEPFYLFRLLVHYRVESPGPIPDELRIDLSSALTSLLHNGGAAMSWLSSWLTAKIADLGARVEALNPPGERRIIFFLKGGRALNYFLGTPEQGQNDWDTQVVIDPSLPAADWYALFSRVHHLLLEALRDYNAEFAELVQQNAQRFFEYLETDAAQSPLGDEEDVDENEARDLASDYRRASCKAELIDIGIPRRDTASGLEEWSRLSREGALVRQGGVIFPNRAYYVNEYLMMIREAFQPKAEVHKLPKRVRRLGLLLRKEAPTEPPPADRARLEALPKTMEAIAALDNAPRKELFVTIVTRFIVAYGLRMDQELAMPFDAWAAALIADPPPLPEALAQVFSGAGETEEQRRLCADVGVAHALSERMRRHCEKRNSFILERQELFDRVLLALQERIGPILSEQGAQFAVVGSYAARLHAAQLRVKAERLEPIRRVLVQLQCAAGRSEADLLDTVRAAALEEVGKIGGLEEVALSDTSDPKRRTLALRWKEAVEFDDDLRYRPLLLKIRGAAQSGAKLPVLASIRRIPVLDLRYLASDYLHKSAKIDEFGRRKVLSTATSAILEMMSRFEYVDEGSDSDWLE